MCPKIAKRGEDFHRHLRVDVFLVVRVNRSILKEGRGAMEVIVDALHKFACNRFQKNFANLHVENCSVVLSRCRFVVLAFVVLVSFVLQMGFDMGCTLINKNILVGHLELCCKTELLLYGDLGMRVPHLILGGGGHCHCHLLISGTETTYIQIAEFQLPTGTKLRCFIAIVKRLLHENLWRLLQGRKSYR